MTFILGILSGVWDLWRRLSLGAQIAVIALVLLVVAFGYLWYGKRQAEQRAEENRIEKERLGRENEGLKILTNVANVAIEVERMKEQANAQSNVSKNANANFANVRKLDSNKFSNDFVNAKSSFCQQFPADSLCR